jgi:peptidoglycan-associated lipoprotein
VSPSVRAWEQQLNRKILIVLVSAAVLAAGCASKPKRADTPATAASTTGAGTAGDGSGAVTTVDADRGVGSGGALGPAGALGSQRVIYFDFDSSDIRNEYVDVIAAHGRFLAGNATVRVRLEGHTDERGSREYNIGLAERRSQTVRRALALQGVQESQIATVSYGEERPAAAGSDENAYSKNRRVEIVYIN